MEKTITFTMTETQVEKFEKLLDEFNSLINQTGSKGKKETVKKSDTSILLSQAKAELKKIKRINAGSRKMIWEQ